MYVSTAEREKLGGVFTFILPIVLVSVAAAIATYGAYGGEVPFAKDLLPLIAPVLLTFVFLWRASAAILSFAGSIALGILIAITQILGAPIAGILLSAWIAIALKSAVIDNAQLPKGEGHAFFSLVFPRLIALPIIAFLAVSLSLLFVVMMTAIFQVSVNFDIAGDVTESFLSDMQSLPRTVFLALVGAFFGLVVAIVRLQAPMIGAVRYALLWAARYLFPIIVVIGWAVCAASIGNENYADLERVSFWRSIVMLLFAVFALVYIDGSQEKPALWLRISLWCALPLIGLLLSGSWSVWASLDVIGRAVSVMLSVLAVALLTISSIEFFRKGKGWMPLYAYAQIAALFVLLFSPVILTLF